MPRAGGVTMAGGAGSLPWVCLCWEARHRPSSASEGPAPPTLENKFPLRQLPGLWC